jgi:BirA family transcriptional regulator, biotin operon repressor / biotin---[acetyl-CoA-carboxylase] ligase
LWNIHISKKKNIVHISNLLCLLKTDSIFKEFYYFDTLPSTQDFAFKLIKRKNIINPSVIICNIQTNGKGRKGTRWASPKGGIWISLILESNLKIEKLFIFVMISAICICETIEKETHLKTDLKWPNDIFVNGKKIAGILLDIEANIDDKNNKIILGIGINTNNDVDSTVLEIKKNHPPFYQITTLKKELNGNKVSNMDFLSKLLNNLDIYLLKINSNSFNYENIFEVYKDRIMNSKNKIHYAFKNNDNSTFDGELIDLNNDGTLLVRDSSQNKNLKISSANNVESI